MLMLQSPAWKFWSNSRTVEVGMPAMFQVAGSSLGNKALRLAGLVLNSIRPTCWMYHVPVLRT